MQPNPIEIKDMLLKGIDNDFNVVDDNLVERVVVILEEYPITPKILQETRLGKYINEVRKKTENLFLAKRAKQLVKKWQNLISSSKYSSPITERINGSNGKLSPLVNTPLSVNCHKRKRSPSTDVTQPPKKKPLNGLRHLNMSSSQTSSPLSSGEDYPNLLSNESSIPLQSIENPGTTCDVGVFGSVDSSQDFHYWDECYSHNPHNEDWGLILLPYVISD